MCVYNCICTCVYDLWSIVCSILLHRDMAVRIHKQLHVCLNKAQENNSRPAKSHAVGNWEHYNMMSIKHTDTELNKRPKKLRWQWKPLPTLIKEKEPLWYRVLWDSSTKRYRNTPMEIRRVAGLTWNRLLMTVITSTGKCASDMDKSGSVVQICASMDGKVVVLNSCAPATVTQCLSLMWLSSDTYLLLMWHRACHSCDSAVTQIC